MQHRFKYQLEAGIFWTPFVHYLLSINCVVKPSDQGFTWTHLIFATTSGVGIVKTFKLIFRDQAGALSGKLTCSKTNC